MAIAMEKRPVLATGHPTHFVGEDADHRLNIAVIFTSVESTLAALKEAGGLARQLGARIRLIVPKIVPYPLPLEAPPMPGEVTEQRFRLIASGSAVETSVQICLCRDPFDTASVLTQGAIVVLGGAKRWWRTKNEKLARRLRRAGYEVIFKETD